MARPVLACAAAALALTACVVSPTATAPIEERSQSGRPPQTAAAAPAPPAAPATREAHDGQYVVQPGDTLYSIALAFGQDFRDLVRWNGLDDPTHIHVGQALRVAPPPTEESGGAAVEATPIPVSPSGALETRPLAPSAATAPESAAAPAAPPRAGDAAGAPMPPSAAVDKGADKPAERTAAVEPERIWAWPALGNVLERFDETRNKGIDISGNVGDPVSAANDGQVVYSGSGLHGYGKLVIIKHTDDYVSAYANNNEILVTQGQTVKRGQHIADLGMTDAPTPRLHFEIRRRGTPVDPLTYLPPR
jgi:lipoprotein NlpD